MSRPYTGNTDGPSKTGRRPGTETLMAYVRFISKGQIKNWGTLAYRSMIGKPGNLSVHATGRALDFGYSNRAEAERWIAIFIENADLLQVEFLADYYPAPGGRGWKCDREAWRSYKPGEISGAPGGKWLHLEIAPAIADDPKAVQEAFKQIFGG